MAVRAVKSKQSNIRDYVTSAEHAARSTGVVRAAMVLVARYQAFCLRVAAKPYKNHPDYDLAWR